MNRSIPAISPISFAAIRTPIPRSAKFCGATLVTSRASSSWSALIVGVSSVVRRIMSVAIRTRTLGCARCRRRATFACQTGPISARLGTRYSGRRSCSCQRSSQIRRVRASTRRSRCTANSRISSSGPASRAAGSVSRPSRSAARATASASIGSDLPGSRTPRRRVGHQPWREPQHRLAVIDQEPLQRPGDMPAVFDHPHALARQRARPTQQFAEPRSPRRPRAGGELEPQFVHRDRRCVCLCGSTPIVNIYPSPSVGVEADSWRTIFSWGDATLLSGHARLGPWRRRATSSMKVRTIRPKQHGSARRRQDHPLRAARTQHA